MAQYKLTQTGSEIQDILNKADKLPTTVGTNGQVLTSDGTDLLWQTPSSTENINFNDTTTTATDTALNNIVVGNSTDGYTRYIVPEGGANIVTITISEANGAVLSEERVAQIRAADGLLLVNDIFWKYTDSDSYIDFVMKIGVNANTGTVNRSYLRLSKTTKTFDHPADTLYTLPCDRIISTFSSSKSYYPGDLVVLRNSTSVVYRCITAHTGAWDANDFTQVVLADEVHSDIVTISATGVQSDKMATKILNAKAIVYNGKLYPLFSKSDAELVFRSERQSLHTDYTTQISYQIATKNLGTPTEFSYNRVTAIGGQSGGIGVDNSLEVKSGYAKQLALTGKLPYLDTLPSSDNTSGFITIVKCTSEPAAADRHEGYLYIVVPSAQ